MVNHVGSLGKKRKGIWRVIGKKGKRTDMDGCFSSSRDTCHAMDDVEFKRLKRERTREHAL